MKVVERKWWETKSHPFEEEMKKKTIANFFFLSRDPENLNDKKGFGGNWKKISSIVSVLMKFCNWKKVGIFFCFEKKRSLAMSAMTHFLQWPRSEPSSATFRASNQTPMQVISGRHVAELR